jgi:hypothetical protein
LLISDAIVAAAEEEGFSVTVDVPFAGALVPLSSYWKDHRISSVMIEVNIRQICQPRAPIPPFRPLNGPMLMKYGIPSPCLRSPPNWQCAMMIFSVGHGNHGTSPHAARGRARRWLRPDAPESGG